MKLKVRRICIESPKVIALVNSKTAESLNMHLGDSIIISSNGKSISSGIDTTDNLVDIKELALSEEGLRSLGVQEGNIVRIEQNHQPRSLFYIMKKLNGHKLTKDEIFTIIREIVDNSLNDVEIAYFV